MFYGAIVKTGSTVTPSSEHGPVLHLSQACLGKGGSGRSTLKITTEDGTFNICSLKKDSIEHTSFDLFIPTFSKAELMVEGASDIHITGYYEPDKDDSMFDGLDSDDELDDDALKKAKPMLASEALERGSKVAEEVKKDQLKSLSFAASKAEQSKAEVKDKPEASSEDEESEDYESVDDASDNDNSDKEMADNDDKEEEEEDSDDDEEDDDDEQLSADEAIMHAINQAKVQIQEDKKKGKPNAAAQQQALKRKTPTAPINASSPAAKRGKKQATETKSSATSADDIYQKAVVDFIKKAATPTPVSLIGNQVKKPAGVKKLGAFLKERPKLFKIHNGIVSVIEK